MASDNMQQSTLYPGSDEDDLNRWWRILLLPLLLFLLTSEAQGNGPYRFEELSDIGRNPGQLRLYTYRPEQRREGLPLVVGLHGCTQRARDFAEQSGLMAMAEQVGLVLALPEQQESNMSRRCFRWYDSDDNRPGEGESASILAMIDAVVATENINPAQVFVMGLSAGGSMTAVMLANHPERFAGGAIFAGLPVGCNRPRHSFDMTWYWLHHSPFAIDGADASYACGIAGFWSTDREADQWADFIRHGSSAPDRWPLISLWQGLDDATVDPDNLSELIEQWTAVQGIDQRPTAQETVGDATRRDYHDDDGQVRVQAWSITGLGHAVPIDGDAPAAACGHSAEHATDIGLCAIRQVFDFWRLADAL